LEKLKVLKLFYVWTIIPPSMNCRLWAVRLVEQAWACKLKALLGVMMANNAAAIVDFDFAPQFAERAELSE
jgi:hypothetical protein